MQDRKIGTILILLSAFFFALMAATVKFLTEIPLAEKIFFRNLLGLFVAAIVLVRKRESFLGNNKPLLLLRSGFGLLGVAFYFFAISRLPLADASILNQMSPFFVLILAALFLKEKIKRKQWLAVFLSLLGASLVIKPQFSFSILPALCGLLSSFFAASAYTTIRQLRHTDSSETIVFYFTLFSTITMIPFMALGHFVVPDLSQLVGLFFLGLFATIAQFCMTYAYRYAPAGELAIYNYTNIIFAALLGLIIWGEMPDLLSIIGGSMIIIAGLVNYLNK